MFQLKTKTMKKLIIIMLLLVASNTFGQLFKDMPDKYKAEGTIESFLKYDFVDQEYKEASYDSTASIVFACARLTQYKGGIIYLRIVFKSQLGETTHDFYVSDDNNPEDGNGILTYTAVSPFGATVKYQRDKAKFMLYYDLNNVGSIYEGIYKYVYKGVIN